MQKTLEISIKKEYLNIFLNKLWDNFNEKFGSVGCFHSHFKTNNPEIYEYKIDWCTDETPFSAQISFIHHTSDGLKSIKIDTKDKSTNEYSEYYQDQLILIINSTKSNYLSKTSNKKYAKIKITSDRKLSGNYIFKKSEITLISGKDGFDYIIIPITSTHKSDIDSEIKEKSTFYLSILSLLSLNNYDYDSECIIEIYATEIFKKEIKNVIETGIYFTDTNANAIETCEFRTKINENCLSNINNTHAGDSFDKSTFERKIIFPHYTDEMISLIFNKHEHQQSCLRFNEALNFNKLVQKSLKNINLISYEIIAYVASLEAILDTKKEFTEIKCLNCGETIEKEEWKISKKFNELIKNINENLSSNFKQLYEDRSKFVHTGKSLYSISAYRTNRPMKIIGKNIESRSPSYYFNMSELTSYILRNYFYKKIIALI
ncbi:hypothetical protein ABE607_11025 [Comamonas aquatica]|uniref:hypothetical protein n=1 Tax=Comamonas aquatica TaxID=225991 RepID=UPI00320A0894